MPGFPPGAGEKGARASAPVHRQMAREFYGPILPIVADLRRRGYSLRAIARELDRRGIKTRQDFQRWNAAQVRRVLARAGEVEKLCSENNAAAAPIAGETPTQPPDG